MSSSVRVEPLAESPFTEADSPFVEPPSSSSNRTEKPSDALCIGAKPSPPRTAQSESRAERGDSPFSPPRHGQQRRFSGESDGESSLSLTVL